MLRLDRSKSFAHISAGDRSTTLFWLLMLCLLTAVQLPGLRVNFASAATDWSQIDKVMMSDPSNNDEFGGSVALSADGNTLAATAPNHAIAGRSSGVLYIFVRSNSRTAFVQVAKLASSDGDNGDRLGQSIAVSSNGSLVVAGAPGAQLNQRGAVYVFARPNGGWSDNTQTAKLEASDATDFAGLGESVAMSAAGDTIVVGAPAMPNGGTERGSVYIFTKPATGWANSTQTAKLSTSDIADGDFFGKSVAISANGQSIVAGSPFRIADTNLRGAVYVFVQPSSGWVSADENAKLTPIPAVNVLRRFFGWSVGVSSNSKTIIIGAPTDTTPSNPRGAAYLYMQPLGGWSSTTQTAELSASDGTNADGFGWRVSTDADSQWIVIGAIYSPAGGKQRGAAYVYARSPTGWANTLETAKLTASDGEDTDFFGFPALNADGSTLVVGAPYNAAGGSKRGAVYVFQSSVASKAYRLHLPMIIRASSLTSIPVERCGTLQQACAADRLDRGDLSIQKR